MEGTFLQTMREWLNLGTYLCDPFKDSAGLMCLSAIANRKIVMKHSLREYYPNLYLMLVGQSNAGKGVAIHDAIEGVLRNINKSLLLPKTFSPEGLLKDMEKRPRGIVCNDELTSLIRESKYMAGLPIIFTELYDSSQEEYIRKLVTKSYVIKKPYLCLAFGVQPEVLTNVVMEQMFDSGFMPRFIVVAGWGLEHEKKDDNINLRIQLTLHLKELCEALAKRQKPIRLELTAPALRIAFAYSKYLKHELGGDPILSYYNRVVDQIFKLGMLYWLDENTKNIISGGTLTSFDDNGRYGSIGYYGSFGSYLSLSILRNDGNSLNGQKGRNGQKGKTPFSPGETGETGETPKTLKWDTDEFSDSVIAIRHIKLAIRFLEEFREKRDSLLRSCFGTADTKLLQKFHDSIDKLIEIGKLERIDGKIYLHNRDICKKAQVVQQNKAGPFISMLQQEGVLGKLERKPIKKTGRPAELYEYLGNGEQ